MVLVDCGEDTDETNPQASSPDNFLRRFRLDSLATAALAWDAVGSRIACVLSGGAGAAAAGDTVAFFATGESGEKDRVPLPPGCGVIDLSLSARKEDGAVW